MPLKATGKHLTCENSQAWVHVEEAFQQPGAACVSSLLMGLGERLRRGILGEAKLIKITLSE